MDMTNGYLGHIERCLKALREEEPNLDAAAGLMSEACRNDGLIHVFGTDPHSASAGDELFFKGGGLANINPFYDPAFSLTHGAYRCSLCQELNGLAPVIMEYYENVKAGDPIIIIGSRPDSSMFAQAVEKAVDMKLRVIAITSMADAEYPAWASKVDVLIDNHSPVNDSVMPLGGTATGGVSTVLTVTLLNLLVAKTIEKFSGAQVWEGSRTVDASQKPLVRKFIERIRHL